MKSKDRAAQLVSEIRAYCKAHADPQKAEKYRRYFREGYDAWGLMDRNNPVWEQQKQDWLNKYADLKLSAIISAGTELFRSGKYEEGALAIHFAAQHLADFDRRLFARLQDWFESGIANWAHADVLCGLVIGPLLAGETIYLSDLEEWQASGFKYQRRAIPVSMLSIVKTADIPPMLNFIRPMMHDTERVVHQGLGWFLREAWKVAPQPVERFLLEFKDTSPRLIFQYATEKMKAADKQRFRAAKKAARAARA